MYLSLTPDSSDALLAQIIRFAENTDIIKKVHEWGSQNTQEGVITALCGGRRSSRLDYRLPLGDFFNAHWHVDNSLNQRNNALINLPFVPVGIVFISTVERIV